MPNDLYRVEWSIEVDAPSYREAAKTALAIQRDRNSHALLFEVKKFDSDEDIVRVDLLEE